MALEPGGLEILGDHVGDPRVVLDDQDRLSHRFPLRPMNGPASQGTPHSCQRLGRGMTVDCEKRRDLSVLHHISAIRAAYVADESGAVPAETSFAQWALRFAPEQALRRVSWFGDSQWVWPLHPCCRSRERCVPRGSWPPTSLGSHRGLALRSQAQRRAPESGWPGRWRAPRWLRRARRHGRRNG